MAIRVVKHDFCSKLIKEYGKPLVSTSANISGTPTPSLYRDISEFIKSNVNYIVQVEQDKLQPAAPSTVIKMDESGSYQMIRP